MTERIRLVMTCGGCPEQYEAYLGDRQVGYLRLRHGHFRVDYPSHGGETIYESDTRGDGSFTDEERSFHLNQACAAILAKERGGGAGDLFVIDQSEYYKDNNG